MTFKVFTFVFLIFFSHLVQCQAVSVDELLASGQCEPFDDFPISCQSVMVAEWSSVWTAPAYGLTQEYFIAQMNIVDPQLGMNPLDLVNIFPEDCAFQYLKMICPTYLRPCTSVSPNPLIPNLPPAIPHSVCRSVCEVYFFFIFIFIDYLLIIYLCFLYFLIIFF